MAHGCKLRVGYMQNEVSGLVTAESGARRTAPGADGAVPARGHGHSRYRQFEATARVRVGAERELFFSYVRSRARGDLNDFRELPGQFPGSGDSRPNQFGNLPADLPNRFLAWGVLQLPQGFRIAPVIEYRTGFPYIVHGCVPELCGHPQLPTASPISFRWIRGSQRISE